MKTKIHHNKLIFLSQQEFIPYKKGIHKNKNPVLKVYYENRIFICKEFPNSVLQVYALFLNSSFLTSKSTQVVQFSTTYFTNFVDSDAVDCR